MIKATWDRIHTWLAKNAPVVRASLRPPATRQQIQDAEKALGVRFPDEVRQCYLIHDGQDPDHRGYPPAFLHGWEWLRLERIVDEYNVWKDLVEGGDFEDAASEPDIGVSEQWYDLGWIPLTYSGAGDHHCLDLAPGPGGQVGQIIEMWHDMAARPIVAASFDAWLKEFADELEAGAYHVTESGLEQE